MEDFARKVKLVKISTRGIAAAIATAGLLFTGLVPASAADDAATTVTIWTDKTRHEAVGPTLAKLATKNGLTIKWVEKEFGELKDLAIAAIPKGTGPDLIIGPHDWTGSLVAAGVLGTVTLGANSSQLNTGAKAGFAATGKQYGVPLYQENIAIVRNKKVAPTAAKSFDELLKKGLQIQSWSPNGDAYHWQAIMSSFGASEYKRDAAGAWTKTVNLGGAAGEAYAKWLADNKGKIKGYNRTWDQLRCDLAQGKVAYWLSGPWAVGNLTELPAACKGSELKASDIAIDVIPSAGGKTVSQFLGANGVFKSVKVAAAANSVAAGQILTYLGGGQAQLDIYNEKAFLPAHKAALAVASADPIVKGFGAAGKNAVPMPSFAFQQSVFDKVGLTERNIYTGKSKDPVKDWNAMVAAVKKLVK
jgi:arabinogalactan oligomer/maltooligosaccharide transport system substrate-binding protein